MRYRKLLHEDHPAEDHPWPGKQLKFNLVLENVEASALCDRLRDGIQQRNPDNARIKKMIFAISELYGIDPAGPDGGG